MSTLTLSILWAAPFVGVCLALAIAMVANDWS
jgi:hypothetical protein